MSRPSTPPFLRACRLLCSQIQNEAQKSRLHREQLYILAEICVTACDDIAHEAERDICVGPTLAKRARLLELILSDARDFAQDIADRHLLAALFQRVDIPARIAEHCTMTLNDCLSIDLGLAMDTDSIACRDQVGRAADQAELQRLLLRAPTDYTLLVDLMRLGEYSSTLIVSALQRNIDSCADPVQQRFLKKAVEAISSRENVIPRYESWEVSSFELDIGEKLADGGFADVHLGNWRGSLVAIKVMKPQRGTKEIQANEVKVWQGLRHPHIVQLFGASLSEDRPFLVMPFCRHGNLRDYLMHHPSVNRGEIVHGVALGLEYLHFRVPHILHGDVKSVNVLIDGNGAPLLADFGLSRQASDDRADSALLNTRWLAPERIKGGPATTAADIYALGMLVYEVYTGQLPFGDLDEATVSWAVCERGQRPPLDPEIMSSNVISLIEACWHPAPTLRPSAGRVVTRTAPVKSSRHVRSPSRLEMAHPGAFSATARSSGSGSALFERKTYRSSPPSTAPETSRRARPDGVTMHVEKRVDVDRISVLPSDSSISMRPSSPGPFTTPALIAAAEKLERRRSKPVEEVKFYGRGGMNRSTALNIGEGKVFKSFKFGKK